MTNIFFSELESNRFNMKIARATMGDIDLRSINSFIVKNNIDVTVVRIPCEKLDQVNRLEKMGYPFFQADTLVYYSTNFEKYSPKETRNKDIQFHRAVAGDSTRISNLIDVIFPGYTNHYNSNPFIDKKNIMEGYKEWVINFIDAENKIVFIITRNGKDIGFASCSVENGVAEGVLYGVIPEAAGGGVYSDIIRYTQGYMIDKGISSMKVSTQVQNYAVQKVWAREGFFLAESFATIHVNSLLNFSLIEEIKFNLTFSQKDIDEAGKLSGDLNPIHFDDSFAKKVGLEKRITHGLLANGHMSKFFGTEFPGNGTLFMGYKYKFIKPIYPDKTYKVSITAPHIDSSKGIYLMVVKIYDNENNLVLLAYNDLIKK